MNPYSSEELGISPKPSIELNGIRVETVGISRNKINRGDKNSIPKHNSCMAWVTSLKLERSSLLKIKHLK